jgi:hypothetical protein
MQTERGNPPSVIKKENKMKRTVLFLIIAVFSLTTQADDSKLLVWQADGKIVAFSLDEEPVTTYSEGNLVITTTSKTITYPLEQVRKYTYFLPKARLLGDADGNGVVNSDDIKEISLKIFGKPSEKFVEGNADVNGDGKINVEDIVLILCSK